jgi:hypothetical protein
MQKLQSLAPVVMKVYSRILEKRLRREIEGNLEEEHNAFRPIRQTQDHIFTMRMAIDKLLSTGRDKYTAFFVSESGIWYST